MITLAKVGIAVAQYLRSTTIGGSMRRLVLMLVVLVGVSAPAEALTIRDIIELTRAGLGDEVLLALIDVDRGVYAIDTRTLKQLKEAGVSDKVIVALVRSGRERPVEPPPMPVENQEEEPPPPQVVVVDHHDEPQVREVAVPYPVYIPFVAGTSGVHVRRQRAATVFPTTVYPTTAYPTTAYPTTFVPFQSGVLNVRPEVHVPKAPVYWGHGGKLRPDAWNPEPQRKHDRRRDR
jgi:hypothetical protein